MEKIKGSRIKDRVTYRGNRQGEALMRIAEGLAPSDPKAAAEVARAAFALARLRRELALAKEMIGAAGGAA